MEYIIHLTEKCNLNCTYCYEDKRDKDISFEDIKNTIDYINSKKSKTKFFYGMTTNGILLDDDFIKYIK